MGKIGQRHFEREDWARKIGNWKAGGKKEGGWKKDREVGRGEIGGSAGSKKKGKKAKNG